MRHEKLCRELAKLVSASFGASPNGIGKVALTHPDLKSFSIKILNDDKTDEVIVWYGESRGIMGNLVSILTSPRNYEFVIVIGFKNDHGDFINSPILGFRFDWESTNDPGSWLLLNNDKWLELDLIKKLQLAMGMEAMVQEGATWTPGQAPEKLRQCLVSLIEVDETK
jgi:hypothetical protein